MGAIASLEAEVIDMQKNIKLQLSLLMAAASIALCAVAANAQTDYYHSPAYQAEEQAFRARQNEGARLYETYGSNSGAYYNWQARENSFKGMPTNPYLFNQQYYPYPNSFTYPY